MNFQAKQQFQKFERGKCVAVCNGQLTAIRWNDNAVVTVLSNCYGCEPRKNAQRFFRSERKRKMCKCSKQLHNTILTWVQSTWVISLLLNTGQKLEQRSGGGAFSPGLLMHAAYRDGYCIDYRDMTCQVCNLEGRWYCKFWQPTEFQNWILDPNQYHSRLH